MHMKFKCKACVLFTFEQKHLTENSFKNAVITFHNDSVSWNSPSGQEHGVTSTVGLEERAMRVNFDLSFQEAKSKCDNRYGC